MRGASSWRATTGARWRTACTACGTAPSCGRTPAGRACRGCCGQRSRSCACWAKNARQDAPGVLPGRGLKPAVTDGSPTQRYPRRWDGGACRDRPARAARIRPLNSQGARQCHSVSRPPSHPQHPALIKTRKVERPEQDTRAAIAAGSAVPAAGSLPGPASSLRIPATRFRLQGHRTSPEVSTDPNGPPGGSLAAKQGRRRSLRCPNP